MPSTESLRLRVQQDLSIIPPTPDISILRQKVREDFGLSKPKEQPIGLIENIKKGGVSGAVNKALLGIPSTIDAVGILNAANRVKRSKTAYFKSENPSKDYAADIQRIQEYQAQAEEYQRRGMTIPAKIGQVLGDMIPYVAEFYATGGAATAAKAGVKGVARKLIGQAAERGVGKVATKLTGQLAATAARTALSPQEVLKRYADTSMPTMAIDAKGKPTFIEQSGTPSERALKAFGYTYIQFLSEESGGAMTATGQKFGKMLASKSRVIAKLGESWTKATGGNLSKFYEKIGTKTGYNGILEEMGEERLADFLTAITNTDSFGTKEDATVFDRLKAAIPTGKQLAVEAISFGIPGVARNVAGRMMGSQQQEQQPIPEHPQEQPQLTPEQQAVAEYEQQLQAMVSQPTQGQPEAPVASTEPQAQEVAVSPVPEQKPAIKPVADAQGVDGAVSKGKITVDETIYGNGGVGLNIYSDKKLIADMTFSVDDNGIAKIGFIKAYGGRGSLSIGELKEAQKLAKEKFPNIKKFTGDRVTKESISPTPAVDAKPVKLDKIQTKPPMAYIKAEKNANRKYEVKMGNNYPDNPFNNEVFKGEFDTPTIARKSFEAWWIKQSQATPTPITTKPVAKPKPVKKQGNTSKELDKDLQDTFQLSNAGVEDIALEAGVGKLPSAVRKRRQQELSDAKEKGIPEKSLETANDIISNPRAFKDAEEEAGMAVRIGQIRDEIRGITRNKRKTSDVAESQMLSAQLDRAESELTVLKNAYKIGGTKTAQTLSLRGAYVDDGFDVISIKSQLSEALGRPLTDKENQEAEQLANKVDVAQEKIENAQDKHQEVIVKEFIKDSKKKKKLSTTDRASLVDKINELLKEGCLY